MPEAEENPCWERLLRKQLLLLATLVVGVTYLAGINPPGGAWQENASGHKAGDTILLDTHRARHLAFYYCNATALAASVVLMFLLLLKKPRRGVQLVVLRVVMVVDLLGLMAAYAFGSSLKSAETWYIVSLVSASATAIYILFSCACLCYYFSRALQEEQRQVELEEDLDGQAPLKMKERRKVLMMLATFVAVITYVAGLSSLGGSRVQSTAFFYLNAAAFMGSLWVVMQLLIKNKEASDHVLPLQSNGHIRIMASRIQFIAPTVHIIGVLICLYFAYLVGVSQKKIMSFYVWGLSSGFGAFVSTAWLHRFCSNFTMSTNADGDEQGEPVLQQLGSNTIRRNEESRKVRSLILLLSTLAATVTYQAGLHPPGGVWPDDRDGHRAGYPVLMSTQHSRYKVFLYCNSSAFVLSMSAIPMIMVKTENIHTRLLVSMILDMVALMGAYAAGSWMDARSSIYVVALACGVIIYLMIHLLCVTVLRTMDMEETKVMKKRHKRLLLVAILVATITYQAGLNPPSGFRRHEGDGQAAGAALLMENYPRRFWAFFYCNTISFMSTLALIFFFTSPNLYRRAIRCYALYGCILLALLCLMAAYGAIIVERTHTDHHVLLMLLAMVVFVIGVHIIRSRAFLLKKEEEAAEEDDEDRSSAVFGVAHMRRSRPRPRQIPRPSIRLRSAQEMKYRQMYAVHKHSILIGILAAGATYVAGLNPPGGLWQDNGDHGGAGKPVMYDRYRLRYYAFSYGNSTSFVTSVFIISLQLLKIPLRHAPKPSWLPALVTNIALMVDFLGLLVAYAAGATRGWKDSIALFVLLLFCLAIHAAPWIQATLYSLMHLSKATAGAILACITERSRS